MDTSPIRTIEVAVFIPYVVFAFYLDRLKGIPALQEDITLEPFPNGILCFISVMIDAYILLHLLFFVFRSFKFSRAFISDFNAIKLLILSLVIIAFMNKPIFVTYPFFRYLINLKVFLGLITNVFAMWYFFVCIRDSDPSDALLKLIICISITIGSFIWSFGLERAYRVMYTFSPACGHPFFYRCTVFLLTIVLGFISLLIENNEIIALNFSVAFLANGIAMLQTAMASGNTFCETRKDLFLRGILGNELLISFWFSIVEITIVRTLEKKLGLDENSDFAGNRDNIYVEKEEENSVKKECWIFYVVMLALNQMIFAGVNNYKLFWINRSTVVQLFMRGLVGLSVGSVLIQIISVRKSLVMRNV